MLDIPDWDIGFKTDPGQKRKGEPNQDSVLVIPGQAGKAPLMIVADGMGGYRGGETASRLVVETILAVYQQAVLPVDYAKLLADCLLTAHSAMRSYAAENSELESMGSTAVIAAMDSGFIYVANVGDSRAYILRGREVRQVNFDHSEVAEQVRAGLITPLQALRHPRRNRLTQSISARRLEIKPYVVVVDLGPDDTILLCTDGLWGLLAESVVQAVALEFSPQQAVEKLVLLANNSGAPDNVTVVIARKKMARITSLTDEDEFD